MRISNFRLKFIPTTPEKQPWQILFNFNPHRAMVAVHHVRADEGAFEARAQRSGDEKIINAPADVPRARAGHRTPPSVMSPARLEFAEGVHEARVHERAESVALLDG